MLLAWPDETERHCFVVTALQKPVAPVISVNVAANSFRVS